MNASFYFKHDIEYHDVLINDVIHRAG